MTSDIRVAGLDRDVTGLQLIQESAKLGSIAKRSLSRESDENPSGCGMLENSRPGMAAKQHMDCMDGMSGTATWVPLHWTE